MKIQCCKKSEPNCQDEDGNVLDSLKTKFVVRTMVYSHKGEGVINYKSLIREGELRHINRMGIFLYKPKSISNQLRAVSYVYWSDCLNKSIQNQPLEGCKARVYREVSKFQKSFDVSIGGGMKELGDLNI